MQIVILCGGKGTRIRDVSEVIPKPMLPIGNRPILWHIMKHYDYFGFRKFTLCLGYKAEFIKQYFLNYQYMNNDFSINLKTRDTCAIGENGSEDWDVFCINTGMNAMTGFRIKRLERFLNGGPFMVTYGDAVSTVDVRALLEFHSSHGRIATVTGVHPLGRFGELEVKGDMVTAFNEKPHNKRDRINGGYFVFEPQVFDFIEEKEDEVLEKGPLNRLARENQLMVFCHDGFWQPMDTLREYEKLNRMWGMGKAAWKIWS